HLVPRLAAVGRLVDAALRVRPVGVTLRAYPRDVGIGRVHPHPRDLLRLGEPEGGPRLAAVSRFPDPVARGDIATDRVLAGADVDDVRIGLGDAERADGAAEVLVRHGHPGVT